MEERKIVFEFVGVQIYQSDLSEEAVTRLNEELVRKFHKANWYDTRTEIAKSGILTTKSLNEVLLNQLENRIVVVEHTSVIIRAILSNPNLEQIDEKIWKKLSENYEWKLRKIAAESRFATEERLQEMIEHELKVGIASAVIEAILSNPNLKQIDEEIWTKISEDKYWRTRKFVAESCLATEKRLQKMLKEELDKIANSYEIEAVSYVIEAILSNQNLEQIDDYIWELLSQNNNRLIRKIAAKCRFATEERLQKMLKHESEAVIRRKLY